MTSVDLVVNYLLSLYTHYFTYLQVLTTEPPGKGFYPGAVPSRNHWGNRRMNLPEFGVGH